MRKEKEKKERGREKGEEKKRRREARPIAIYISGYVTVTQVLHQSVTAVCKRIYRSARKRRFPYRRQNDRYIRRPCQSETDHQWTYTVVSRSYSPEKAVNAYRYYDSPAAIPSRHPANGVNALKAG